MRENNDAPLPLWQIEECFLHGEGLLLSDQELTGAAGEGRGISFIVDLKTVTLGLSFAHAINGKVSCDRVQPRRDASFGFVLRSVGPGAQKGFLGYVFCLGVVVEQSVGEGHDGLKVVLREDPKSGGIALSDALHERLIFQVRVHGLGWTRLRG